MLTYSDRLLEQSLQNYWSTNDRHFEFSIVGVDSLSRCIESCRNLSECGFITNVSDNMSGGTVNVTFDTIVSFDITDDGVKYILEKHKTQT